MYTSTDVCRTNSHIIDFRLEILHLSSTPPLNYELYLFFFLFLVIYIVYSETNVTWHDASVN